METGAEDGMVGDDPMDIGCEGLVRGAVGVEGVALGCDKIAGTTRKTLGSSTGSSGYNFFFLGVGIVDARESSVENVGGLMRV